MRYNSTKHGAQQGLRAMYPQLGASALRAVQRIVESRPTRIRGGWVVRTGKNTSTFATASGETPEALAVRYLEAQEAAA